MGAKKVPELPPSKREIAKLLHRFKKSKNKHAKLSRITEKLEKAKASGKNLSATEATAIRKEVEALKQNSGVRAPERKSGAAPSKTGDGAAKKGKPRKEEMKKVLKAYG